MNFLHLENFPIVEWRLISSQSLGAQIGVFLRVEDKEKTQALSG